MPGVKYEKHLQVPLTFEMWEKLREISYHKQISMNNLAREGFEYIIKKYLKKGKKDID